MVQLQKEGQTILGGGLGGALTERFFVVDAANKVLRLTKMLRDCLAPSVGDEKVKHMCKALEKLYAKEDVAERPPLQGLKDLLSALDDKTVKIANRPAAKALRKPLLQFYELERGNPERDGGGNRMQGDLDRSRAQECAAVSRCLLRWVGRKARAGTCGIRVLAPGVMRRAAMPRAD